MAVADLIPISYLHEALSHDADTGALTWPRVTTRASRCSSARRAAPC
jgi:hypothetical protein